MVLLKSIGADGDGRFIDNAEKIRFGVGDPVDRRSPAAPKVFETGEIERPGEERVKRTKIRPHRLLSWKKMLCLWGGARIISLEPDEEHDRSSMFRGSSYCRSTCAVVADRAT